jgi:hypothetical protein
MSDQRIRELDAMSHEIDQLRAKSLSKLELPVTRQNLFDMLTKYLPKITGANVYIISNLDDNYEDPQIDDYTIGIAFDEGSLDDVVASLIAQIYPYTLRSRWVLTGWLHSYRYDVVSQSRYLNRVCGEDTMLEEDDIEPASYPGYLLRHDIAGSRTRLLGDLTPKYPPIDDINGWGEFIARIDCVLPALLTRDVFRKELPKEYILWDLAHRRAM